MIDLLRMHDMKYPWDDQMLTHYIKTLKYDNLYHTQHRTGYIFNYDFNLKIQHNILTRK